MCGIAGYICLADKKPDKEIIKQIFINSEKRGKDASGWAYFQDNELKYHKDALPSSKMVETEEWNNLELPSILIMHTRAYTQGLPSINTNNHPIINTSNTRALVHNGVIYNERDFGIDDNTVDSQALMAAWETLDGNYSSIFKEVDGGYAVGLIENANRLILFRHTNPIELVCDKEDNIIYFASVASYIMEPLSELNTIVPWYNFKLRKGRFMTMSMADNSHMVIQKEIGLVEEEVHTYTTKHTVQVYSSRRNYGYNHNYGYGSEYDDEYYGGLPGIYPMKASKVTALLAKPTIPKLSNVDIRLLFAASERFAPVDCPYCHSVHIIDKKNISDACVWCSRIIKIEDLNENNN